MAIISEPYYIPTTNKWIGDKLGLAAIVKGPSAPAALQIKKGKGFVTAKFGKITVCSCYSSPNARLRVLEELLSNISIALAGEVNVIIAGDFNAKAVMWGAKKTDARGKLVERWAASMGLTLQNRGNTPTCERAQGSSIIDLTWTRGTPTPRMRNWRVDRWEESHSDHNHIWFDMNGEGWKATAQYTQRTSWNIKKFNEERFEVSILGATWSSDILHISSAEEKARRLTEIVTQACDEAMPRKKQGKPPKHVYWWNDDIAQCKKECKKQRRILTRIRKKPSINEMDKKIAHLDLKDKKRELRKAINKAKAEEHTKFIATIDDNPWGRPYKLVMDKLNNRGDPPTFNVTARKCDPHSRSIIPPGETPGTALAVGMSRVESSG